MVGSVPEENVFICYFSEGTEIGAADSNRTWDICCHYDYYSLRFLLLFGGYSKPNEDSKLKDNQGGDAADCYDAILVNVESLESSGAFKPEHLGYIIRIFENTSDSRFHLWATQKYKEVMEFVKKPLLCDEDVMQTNNIITYGLLTQ